MDQIDLDDIGHTLTVLRALPRDQFERLIQVARLWRETSVGQISFHFDPLVAPLEQRPRVRFE